MKRLVMELTESQPYEDRGNQTVSLAIEEFDGNDWNTVTTGTVPLPIFITWDDKLAEAIGYLYGLTFGRLGSVVSLI